MNENSAKMPEEIIKKTSKANSAGFLFRLTFQRTHLSFLISHLQFTSLPRWQLATQQFARHSGQRLF